MQDRRTEPRYRLDLTGGICLDEHRTVPCIVYDQLSGGVRVTLPEAEAVPDNFVLTIAATAQVLVCEAVWRGPEEIGARIASAGPHGLG